MIGAENHGISWNLGWDFPGNDLKDVDSWGWFWMILIIYDVQLGSSVIGLTQEFFFRAWYVSNMLRSSIATFESVWSRPRFQPVSHATSNISDLFIYIYTHWIESDRELGIICHTVVCCHLSSLLTSGLEWVMYINPKRFTEDFGKSAAFRIRTGRPFSR